MANILTVLIEEAPFHRDSNILIDRAGVCLFLADPELRQEVENDTGLYF
jgi:hypothetical protein